jgi:PAS domain S-box-containing protein
LAATVNNTMQNSVTWEQEEAGGPVLAGIGAYGLAAVCVGLAFLLRWLLDPLWRDRLPFATFFITVVVVAQFLDVGPSVFAMVAGFLLGDWFFLSPRHNLLIRNPVDEFNAVCYFLLSFGVLVYSLRVRRALARERAARTALSKLTAIIESSDDAIIGKSLSGKILSWNAGACQLFGYTEAEAVGQPITFLLEPGRGEELAPVLERAGRGEHINVFETTRAKKDGELVEVSLSISPVRNSAGQIVGLSTIARDVAERRRAEHERERLVGELRQEVAEREAAQRALQESQELTLRQERLAAVGRLAAGLAHEFNNILTVIQGHASLLLDNPNMDEDSVKSITHITEGVERTAALVKQMLAFSRKQVMQQKVMHIKDAMSQIADMLGRLLGAHVVLRFDIAPQLPPILADPDMLQQIIVNLVVNARDAMGSGGQVTIRAGEVQLAAKDLAGKPERRPGRFVQLSVTDTGSGIEPATIAHLFEPFFTTKEVGKGTGLGLATVHGMVNQNAGWIEVDSKVGRGTTFNIYFPTADKAPEKRAPDRGMPKARGNGETILVVEDEAVLRDLVREILAANGYRVLAAASGREALQVWEKHGESIRLVLTDMSMPDGMSGQELAAKLQEHNPRLPVIFSSGYAQETLQQKEQGNHDTTFLSKPYHPADLAQSVRAALDKAARGEASVASPKT